jgi:hypothetical protein
MINHARTLLLNVEPRTYNIDLLGEEFIPAFSAIKLPSYIERAHRILFGTDPDKVFLNFRAYELLSLIHRTELAEFVYALDPRVTYATTGMSDFFRADRTTEVEKITGVIRSNLHLSGAATADTARGRAYYEYVIRIINDTPTTAIAEIAPVTGATTNNTVRWAVSLPLTFKAQRPVMRVQTPELIGLSEPSPIQDTGLQFQLSLGQLTMDLLADEDAITIETESLFKPSNIAVEYRPQVQAMRMPLLKLVSDPQVIAAWRLKIFVKPVSAISTCLPRLEFLGEPFYLQLFGVGNSSEPYTTFKNIWLDHPNPAYRLGAFALAMIYRTEEVRSGVNG